MSLMVIMLIWLVKFPEYKEPSEHVEFQNCAPEHRSICYSYLLTDLNLMYMTLSKLLGLPELSTHQRLMLHL